MVILLILLAVVLAAILFKIANEAMHFSRLSEFFFLLLS